MGGVTSQRKGISPLIAAVLLIAFTMAVAAILTAFVTQYTRDTTGSVGNESQRLIECSQARITILSAVFNATQPSGAGTSYLWLNVTVENRAQGNLTGFTISAFDTADTFIGSKSFDSVTIEGANIKKFNISNDTIEEDPALSEVRIRSQRCDNAQDTFTDLTNRTA